MYLLACFVYVVIRSFLLLSSGPFSDLFSSLAQSSPKVPYSVAVGSLRETISPISMGLLLLLSDSGPVCVAVSFLPARPGRDAPLVGLLGESLSVSILNEFLRTSRGYEVTFRISFCESSVKIRFAVLRCLFTSFSCWAGMNLCRFLTELSS